MSWRDVLKDSKQTSRTMGSIDWEKETIPDNEEDNCLKQLKEYYDKAKNHPYATDKRLRGDGVAMNAEYFRFDSIPEEVACAVVDRIKSVKKSEDSGGYRKININGNTYWYVVRYRVYETYAKYQKFRVSCYDLEMESIIRFGTKSLDLDADIDFR